MLIFQLVVGRRRNAGVVLSLAMITVVIGRQLPAADGRSVPGTDGWGSWQPYAPISDRNGVCDRVAESFRLSPAPPGKGMGTAEFSRFLESHDAAWRINGGRYRPLFRAESEPDGTAIVPGQLPQGSDPGPQHYRFFLVIETLCKTFPRGDAGQQQVLEERLSDLVTHYVAEWWRWRRGGDAGRGRPGFPVYGFPDYLRVMAEATRLPEAERLAFADVLFDQLAWNHEHALPDVQMDHLKAMVAYLPWVPMLAEGPERQAMIGRAAAFYDRVICCEKTFSADGAIIHHGIWHYAYASYSLTRFLDNLVQWHNCGLSLSATARSYLRRAALVATVLSDNGSRVVPFNVEGRSGGMPRIGAMTDHLLRTVARLGSDEAPTAVWQPAARVLKAVHPEAATAPEFSEIKASREPLMGVWPVNRGGAMIVRRPGWMAVVGGLSPLTGKHEIYSWTQHNNYSIFVRRGGLTIVTDEGNAHDPRLGYGLEEGFDWSLIPGATTEPRTADQLFSRRHNTFVTNSGMAAACGLADGGVWALDQIVGPGPAFRTSLHVSEGRLTSVTTAVVPDQPSVKRPRVVGIPASPAGTPVGTTLFQWPVEPAAGKARPASTAKPPVRRHPGGGWSVQDRYGNAYCLHPGSAGRLRTDRRRQSQVLVWDRYLRPDTEAPIDWKQWTIEGRPLGQTNLAAIADRYMPREGWFDVAGIVHTDERATGLAPATVFTVLPLTNEEETASFAESLTGGASPVQILAANDAHHLLHHPPTGSTTLAVFDPAEPLPPGLPIVRVSRPCTIMLRSDAATLELAAAWCQPAAGEPLVVELQQPATVRPEHGEVGVDGQRLSLRRPDLLPWRGSLSRQVD